MKPTVAQGFQPGAGAAEDARFNREIRAALNQTVSRVATLTTAATGVLTTIWTSDAALDFNKRYVLEATVHGANDGGTVYTYCGYAAMFRRGTSGAGSQLGVTQQLYMQESNAALAVALGLDGDSKLIVQVNDGGLATMKWKAWVEVMVSP